MTLTPPKDWDPETYARFRGHRLRPALDLLRQVPALPHGDIVDLGCGNGAVGAALKKRFDRPLIGVEASAPMLSGAAATCAYDTLVETDAGDWTPQHPPALIFSNALCQWLPDHPALFARLAGLLAAGGTLAVQMPRQYVAPSHALLRSIAEQLFPDRFDFAGWVPPVMAPADYMALLSDLGALDVWETQYLYQLDPVADGHPVRTFTQGTALRPILQELNADEEARFLSAYDGALASAYPLDERSGTVLPFRRVFFILTV